MQDDSGFTPLEREQALFEQCLSLADAERAAFLDELASKEPETAERIRRLLAADEASTALEDSPVHHLRRSPEFIGSYRVLQRLAEGGMGEVYIAEQLEPVRRRVAIKIVKPGMDTREVIARFESERQVLALMNHPNIARILDAGATEGGRPYFVMEYVPGIPLLKYCDDNHLTLEERLRLFMTVCQAIQHAHQKGIIHRDIKPSNILVMEQDGRAQPKVIDFGIAKAITQRLTGDTLFTGIGKLLGTPEYMSPEQADVSPLDVDTRTDVFSLGVVLYELLCGEVPLKFDANSGYRALRERIYSELPPALGSRLDPVSEKSQRIAVCRNARIENLRRELRGELNSITGMAMAKEPGRRYSTVEALMLDVQRYLAHEPVAAKAGQRFYRMRKFMQRHRGGIAALLVSFIAAIAVAASMTYQARQIALERDRANQEAETANQVAAFLGDVFQQADPFTAKGEELTAIEVLEHGVQKLNATLPQPTLARVRLLRILGRVHVNLGRYDAALPLLRRAYQDSLALFGADALETLQSQSEYGRMLIYTHRNGEAKQVFQDNVARWKQQFTGDNIELLKATNNLASVYLAEDDYERALPLLQTACGGLARVQGENGVMTILCNANLAMATFHLGETEAGVNLLADIVHRLDAVLGENHPQTLGISSNLASWYSEMGRFDEADALFRRIYESQQQVLGEAHPDTLMSLQHIARLHQRVGQLDLALSFQQDVIEGLGASLGDGNSSTLQARLVYAEMLVERDPAAAATQADATRRDAARYLGAVNRISVDAARAAALAMLRAGRPAAAKSFLKTALTHGDSREAQLAEPQLSGLFD